MSQMLNPASFKQEVINGRGVSIVRFCTEWNGGCQMMAPLFDELESYYDGYIRFYTIDVDDYPQMTREFGIREIPTILFFKDGAIADHIAGTTSKKHLGEKVKTLLPKNKNNFDFTFFL